MFAYPSALERAVDKIILALPSISDDRSKKRHDALSLIEGDYLARTHQSSDVLAIVEHAQREVLESLHVDADIIIADARYAFIGDITQQVVRHQRKQKKGFESWLDKIVLNRFLGLPIFCLTMYVMFSFAITMGGAFQDFFDLASQAIFVNAPTYFLQKIHSPSWLIVLIAEGLGKGVNTVMTFIPVICGMFLALSFLEQSGYMARAAFVVDRVMRFIGLPGKSFVPMIVGFGCNVPAVLATRTLESQRDRVLTVMMSPFMSCGARLAIFAVFTAAFFPEGGATIVFCLYMIGILIAIITGFILRKTLLKGPSAPFILELPSYHMPSWRSLRLHTWHRLHGFVFKAGILIVPICMLLSVLDTVTIDDHSVSVLAIFGQWVTPIFSPMGVTTENWPATVGLLTGLLAKEVVVGTLNSLYADSNSIPMMLTYSSLQLGPELWEALTTIPENLLAMIQSVLAPFSLSMSGDEIDSNVMGQMYQRFGGAVA
ncbi:MAG: ferrous iron transport protein B, partial [Gammaproteobacteria bacterium]|nr:ferrous iron transport protein B [Gammaproteobacteria bacterium]